MIISNVNLILHYLTISYAAEIPEIFQGIFATFWVFLVVTIVLSLLIFIMFIVVFFFIIRAIIRGSRQVDRGLDLAEQAMDSEVQCQFCEQIYNKSMLECPNCGAPRKE